MKRFLGKSVSILAVLALLGVAACGPGEEAAEEAPQIEESVTLLTPGTLTIGTTNFPPFSAVSPDGEPYGALIDILRHIMREQDIATEIEPIEMPFASLIPALQANQIDMVGDAMYRTPERAEEILYVEYPTMYNPEALVVHQGNPHQVHDLSDLGGLSVGTYQGSVWVEWLEDAQAEDPSVDVNLYPTHTAVIADMGAGRLDVALIDAALAAYALEQDPNLAIEIASDYEPADKESTALYFSVRQGNTALAEELNRGLRRLLAEDRETYEQIVEQAGLAPASFFLVPPP